MLELWKWALSQLSSNPGSWSWPKLVGIVVFGLLLLLTILKALSAAVDQLLNLTDKLQRLGITARWSTERRVEIRRRQQFCTMLASDLATLAKSENWNDQYFADLEAEVEAEGKFFVSKLHRLFRRRSVGIRRVKSLIRAIEDSAETRLLLIGQPGCGKSVALRHLAHQYSERARTSKESRIKIPLYVNLRELPIQGDKLISGSDIREFVLDNVKRGDSDVADYVSEKWTEFRDSGQWLFLLDSFDEIAEVLHSTNESEAIRVYSDAIRHFLDAVGQCKAVVASREFKGPSHLPWHRIRVLPLDDRRQSELIENSFLPNQQKELVRMHVASSDPHTFRNPMFLGLLCRYIKDVGKPPTNDHLLLIGHIERLASRDRKYVQEKFLVDPVRLLEGAKLVAAALAEDQALTLAPSFDALTQALETRLGTSSSRVLDALVYVKIGRTDLPTASPDLRRFAFAHRRYQETLYVLHLRDSEHSHRPRELLLDYRLREYVVTFIESQDPDTIRPLISDAIAILKGISRRQKPIENHELLGPGVGYYDWDDGFLQYLLSQLRDGFARKPMEVPDELRDSIDAVILPRFNNGDFYDRCNGLEYACLMGKHARERCLRAGLRYNNDVLETAATKSIAYLGAVEPELKQRFFATLSDLTIQANGRIELLRLELLALRMNDLSAVLVFKRSKLLNRVLAPPRLMFSLMNSVSRRILPLGPQMTKSQSVAPAEFATLTGFLFAGVGMFSSAGVERIDTAKSSSLAMFSMLALFLTAFLWIACLMSFRAEPHPLSFAILRTKVANVPKSVAALDWAALGIIIAALGAMFLVPAGLMQLLHHAIGWPPLQPITYSMASGAVMLLIIIYAMCSEFAERRRYKELLMKRLLHERRSQKITVRTIMNSGSFKEAHYRIMQGEALLSWPLPDARAFLRLLTVRDPSKLPKQVLKFPLAKYWNDDPLRRRHLRDYALRVVLLERQV